MYTPLSHTAQQSKGASPLSNEISMRLAVFCGSSPGNDPEFRDQARKAGEFLANEGIELVYGGGNLGLMGAVADGCLAAGGNVVGVMPKSLFDKEVGHQGLTHLDVVPNMHVRKERMAELSDGFIALPGGPGTLEEIFEQWTWAQLGIHRKPCAFLNIRGYYEPVLSMANCMVASGFMKAEHRDMLIVNDKMPELLEKLRNYKPPLDKWGETENRAIKP